MRLIDADDLMNALYNKRVEAIFVRKKIQELIDKKCKVKLKSGGYKNIEYKMN